MLYNVSIEDSLMIVQKNPWVAVRELLKYILKEKGFFAGSPHELSLFCRSDRLSQT